MAKIEEKPCSTCFKPIFWLIPGTRKSDFGYYYSTVTNGQTPIFFIFPASIPSFFKNADRIVGGQDAPSEIPWQVSIRQGWFNSGKHWCGGTILDSKTILSAAHCFFDSKDGRDFVKKLQPYIKVGSTNVDGTEAQVQLAPIHYNYMFFLHDVEKLNGLFSLTFV